MRRLTPEERAGLGIHSGPPVTGTDERLEALIAAQLDTAAAVRELVAVFSRSLPQPPEPPADGAVELREPVARPKRRG